MPAQSENPARLVPGLTPNVAFPTTSLATVYKTISVIKELGEVLELEFSNGHNRYDGNKPYPHPHLICVKCKRIVDPELSSLAHLTQELVSDTGYRILSHRLDFYGVCPECQLRNWLVSMKVHLFVFRS